MPSSFLFFSFALGLENVVVLRGREPEKGGDVDKYGEVGGIIWMWFWISHVGEIEMVQIMWHVHLLHVVVPIVCYIIFIV